MYCKKCGDEIPENSKHCYHCGEIFEQKKMSALMIAIHAVAGLFMVGLFVYFLVTIIKPMPVKEVIVEVIPEPTVEPIEQQEKKEPHPYQQQLVGMWEYVDEFEYWIFVFEEDGSYTHYRRGQSTKELMETYRGTYEVESDKTILIDDDSRLFKIEGDVFSIADPYDDYLWSYLKTNTLMLYDADKLQRKTYGKWKCVTEGYEDLVFEFFNDFLFNTETDKEFNYKVYKNGEIFEEGLYSVTHDGLLYFDGEYQDYVMDGWQFKIVYKGEELALEEVW